MKYTTWGVLVVPVWIGLLCGVAFAQQAAPAGPNAASSPAAAEDLLPAVPDVRADGSSSDADSPLLSADSPGANIEGEVFDDRGRGDQALGAFVFGAMAPTDYGSFAPPALSTIQGVRVLSRNRPRKWETTRELKTVRNTEFLDGVVYILPSLETIPRLSTQSPEMGVASGYTGTITRYLGRDSGNCDQFLEFTYWGLNDWSGRATAYGGRGITASPDGPISTGGLISPFPSDLGGFNRADEHSLAYESLLNNF